MIVSQAKVETPSGSRYLQQLCKHWSHKFEVTFDANEGFIPFGNDRTCAFHADEAGLAMRLSAPDEDVMTRFETVVFDHLKRFAFREELPAPVWTRDAPDAGQPR